jgi:SAM-dependent methyltransferase
MARKEEPVAAQNVEGARYHKDVLTLEPDHPWHRLRQLVPPGTEVLDVGCASGDLGRFLADRASHVDGLEPNAERADVARRYLRRVVTGVTGGPTDGELAPAYDVIVFADVIEHIPDAQASLYWARDRLTPNGRIVALIPNSANWKVRRKILFGDWSYADTGYFDRDHIRFYDVRTARRLGADAGLVEAAVEFTPGELPKPFRHSLGAATRATALRPNLFAGHVLIVWQAAS